MKLLYLLFLGANSEKIIKNINIPACKNCVHFKPYIYTDDFTSSLGNCNKFGVKDIVTDKITYDYADLCRKDDSKCGHNGTYFIQEKNIDMKIFKHTIISSIPKIIISVLLIMSLIISAYSKVLNQ